MDGQKKQLNWVERERKAGLDRVIGRLQLLRPPERHWLEVLLLNGSSYRQLAGSTGINRATLARRIERIIGNLRRDDYLILWRRLEDLSPLQRDVAYAFFLLGRSSRHIASDLRRRRETIQKTIDELRETIADEQSGNSLCKL